MGERKQVTVEPLDYRLTGFVVDDLLSKKFVEELRQEYPNAVVGQMVVGFKDSNVVVGISHDRKEGKIVVDYVDVEGGDTESTARIVKVLQKVLS